MLLNICYWKCGLSYFIVNIHWTHTGTYYVFGNIEQRNLVYYTVHWRLYPTSFSSWSVSSRLENVSIHCIFPFCFAYRKCESATWRSRKLLAQVLKASRDMNFESSRPLHRLHENEVCNYNGAFDFNSLIERAASWG